MADGTESRAAGQPPERQNGRRWTGARPPRSSSGRSGPGSSIADEPPPPDERPGRDGRRVLYLGSDTQVRASPRRRADGRRPRAERSRGTVVGARRRGSRCMGRRRRRSPGRSRLRTFAAAGLGRVRDHRAADHEHEGQRDDDEGDADRGFHGRLTSETGRRPTATDDGPRMVPGARRFRTRSTAPRPLLETRHERGQLARRRRSASLPSLPSSSNTSSRSSWHISTMTRAAPAAIRPFASSPRRAAVSDS